MLLKMENISKSFSNVNVLAQVDFELEKGEIHALMGENGAGKSTLMKILTGVYPKDEGEIRIDNQKVSYANTREAQDDGIVIVHQELNILKDLTVGENIFLGRESMSNRLVINDQEINKKSAALFQKLGVRIDPRVKIGYLTVGEAQMVEIAKAISMNSRIIVFDEPTAALSEKEIKDLFKIIRDLKKSGIGIVYISHRMEEIGMLTDRVTVLRDGKFIGTVDTEKTSKNQIIKMMVGRELKEDPKQFSTVDKEAPVVLKVDHLTAGKVVNNVSFQLRKGEILGMAGLMGAGRTETARALFGADKKESGSIAVNGKEVSIKSTTDAIKFGLGYVSEDRRRYGVLVEKSIAENITLSNIDEYTKSGVISEKKVGEVSDQYRKKMNVRSRSNDQKVKYLSGGNQQKVVIAKWLATNSDIIIFDEPTRGIDVGAKAEIYELMDELAESGKSIIMISSDLNELLRMSDRIMIMCEGRKTGELNIEEASQEKILYYATMRNGEKHI